MNNSISARNLIKELIGPLFSELDEHSGVSTYHFNINSNPSAVNIRIFPGSEEVSGIIDNFEQDAGIDLESESGRWQNREQDIQQVGKNNVYILDKQREFGSRIAILAVEGSLSNEYRQGLLERGTHLFGNNLGVFIDINVPLGTNNLVGLKWKDLDQY